MTDKLQPLNMHGHANTWEEELLEVTGERDELRAAIEQTWRPEVKALRARLETAQAAIAGSEKEIERLREALAEISSIGWPGSAEMRRIALDALDRDNSPYSG